MMGYCPFYSKDCPEDSSCKAWKSYGCGAMYKPGIPAIHSGTAVFIFRVFSSNAKATGDILVVYCNAETGIIGTDDTLANFVVVIE